MPSSWSKLRTGMTEREVEPALAEAQGGIGMGKVMTCHYESPMLGAGSYWELTLEYSAPIGMRNDKAKLVGATAQFVHPWCGLLSTRPRRLL